MKDNKASYNSAIYDDNIRKVLPYYDEFHNQIVDLVSTYSDGDINWLDSGCGTGTLAKNALESLGDRIHFTLCDPSEGMLDVARERLSANKDVTFRCISSQQLDYSSQFDVVTSVQSHHYLKEDDREKAVISCFNALKENGMYITFENISLNDNATQTLAQNRWCRYMSEHGRNDEQIQAHMARRGTEVFPITIEKHLSLLRNCGFKGVDVLWVSYMQAGFFAIK